MCNLLSGDILQSVQGRLLARSVVAKKRTRELLLQLRMCFPSDQQVKLAHR